MYTYLLKSSLALFVFIAYYWLILRRDTTFKTNRYYLLVSLLISIFLPLLKINWNTSNETFQAVNNIIIPLNIYSNPQEIAHNQSFSWWTWQHISLLAYFSGIILILLKYILRILPWIKLIPRKKLTNETYHIVKTNKTIPPFSFFNTIFLGNQEFSENELNKIISHEKQHILQNHWIDLMIVDILSIVFWFNPLIWIYDLLIKQNHEYLADNGVIAQGFNKSSYQALLLQQVVGVKIPGLSSSFTQSLIKNRFIMMTKQSSRKIAGIKVLFALPLLVFLTILFAGNTNSTFNSEQYAQIQKGKITGYVYDVTTGKPLEGASVIIKENSQLGTSTNAKGYFEIDNPYHEAHILITYVGYKTEQIKVGENEVKAMMRRDVYQIDLKENQTSDDANYNLPPAPPPPPPAKDKSEKEIPAPPAQTEEYVIVEDMAMPQGGFKGFSDYIFNEIEKYKANFDGTTKVFFVVNEKGKVSNVKVIESSGNKKTDEVAVKIVESIPDWKPAYQRGKNVTSDYTIDIKL